MDKEQLNRMSEIYMGIGHISLASVVIPGFIDRFDPSMLVLGSGWAIFFWAASVYFVRRNK